MGQKVHPYSFRLGYLRDWQSKWFAKNKDFGSFLVEDSKIRKYIKKNLAQAAIAKIEIERSSNKIHLIVHTGRPGVIIGRRGSEIDRLRDEIREITDKEVQIDIKEINAHTLSAQLVAENIAFQLERRVAYRRAIKKAVQQALASGAQGAKIRCSGRLGGAEIARSESYMQGKVPLQTIRSDIDYGFAEALTTYGLIGVKVWIYIGNVIRRVV